MQIKTTTRVHSMLIKKAKIKGLRIPTLHEGEEQLRKVCRLVQPLCQSSDSASRQIRTCDPGFHRTSGTHPRRRDHGHQLTCIKMFTGAFILFFFLRSFILNLVSIWKQSKHLPTWEWINCGTSTQWAPHGNTDHPRMTKRWISQTSYWVREVKQKNMYYIICMKYRNRLNEYMSEVRITVIIIITITLGWGEGSREPAGVLEMLLIWGGGTRFHIHVKTHWAVHVTCGHVMVCKLHLNKTYFKRSIRTHTNGESDHLWGGSGRWTAGQQRILPPYPQCFNFFTGDAYIWVRHNMVWFFHVPLQSFDCSILQDR